MATMQSYMVISQIVLMPTHTEIEKFPSGSIWSGLLPCDGRELSVDRYGALYHIIGKTYGHRWDTNSDNPTHWFNLPTLESPLKGYTYYICVDGEFPQRD